MAIDEHALHRWWRRALGTAAGLIALGGALVTVSPSTDLAEAATRVTCTVATPATAAGFQAMFDAKNDDGWSGGDQAASLPLPDGRTLWVFGDTVLGRQARSGGYAPGTKMVSNSFLLQDRGCLRAVNGPRRTAVIPNARNGDKYWPLAAAVDAGRLVVTAARVRPTGHGPFDFTGVGTEAAVFTLPRLGVPRFERMARLPSTGQPETRPQYGHAIVVDKGYTYVYASRKVMSRLVFGKAVSVARVPVGHLLDLPAWRYWDGQHWRAGTAAAASVVSASPEGWSTSFSVLRRPNGTFQYVTKGNDFLGKAVLSGTSRTPQGAFGRVVVASYPSFTRPGELLYNPLAHPEQRLRDGRLLVSISRNSTSASAIAAHADLYKPQFFSVPAL